MGSSCSRFDSLIAVEHEGNGFVPREDHDDPDPLLPQHDHENGDAGPRPQAAPPPALEAVEDNLLDSETSTSKTPDSPEVSAENPNLDTENKTGNDPLSNQKDVASVQEPDEEVPRSNETVSGDDPNADPNASKFLANVEDSESPESYRAFATIDDRQAKIRLGQKEVQLATVQDEDLDEGVEVSEDEEEESFEHGTGQNQALNMSLMEKNHCKECGSYPTVVESNFRAGHWL
ncbi:hypothetical protein PoB_000955300 [Plakobranchus ocellatus]|uniref:Uncharacterized protein n=1 Tax=Plakobranchus ocellatus TaxID=259542 RepID=A0AAV3YLD9_9GAST|nr:hypothetical protein PoB_000955300 [Plakobranchus ocellatus]